MGAAAEESSLGGRPDEEDVMGREQQRRNLRRQQRITDMREEQERELDEIEEVVKRRAGGAPLEVEEPPVLSTNSVCELCSVAPDHTVHSMFPGMVLAFRNITRFPNARTIPESLSVFLRIIPAVDENNRSCIA